MEFRITCPCGHSFMASAEAVKSPLTCPACAKRLSPVVQADPQAVKAVPAGATSEVTAEPTKRCPFCGEVILAIARKCKHCGEFLDRGAPGGNPLVPGSTEGGATSASPLAGGEEPVF